ncbi:phospholipase A2 large subunit-like [Hydractinia symbiolongicarpus]|uniref:phospholipase A2 large subunit-like n=1 Tax=Hydractinia symbiolongicarpus TaxID=13093 RepID=UPI00254A1B9F|nr:phospholipase A2 large subunit-like [Hydractinia symbiolongicarpus]
MDQQDWKTEKNGNLLRSLDETKIMPVVEQDIAHVHHEKTDKKEAKRPLNAEEYTFEHQDPVTKKEAKRTIYPGTKWCGEGNNAQDYNDLGLLRVVDKCCRAHDHCPRSLLSGAARYGVVNNGMYTVSDCQCDFAFKKCLREVSFFNGGTSAAAISHTYFNILNMKCLKFDQNNQADIVSQA